MMSEVREEILGCYSILPSIYYAYIWELFKGWEVPSAPVALATNFDFVQFIFFTSNDMSRFYLDLTLVIFDLRLWIIGGVLTTIRHFLCSSPARTDGRRAVLGDTFRFLAVSWRHKCGILGCLSHLTRSMCMPHDRLSLRRSSGLVVHLYKFFLLY